MTEKVSIIIPVFNIEDKAQTLIRELKAQDYADFEAILIDDGSIDNTYSYLKTLCYDDDRFLIFSKENGGPASARNYGLKYVTGFYTAFVDSDDDIPHSMLTDLVTAIKDSQASWGIGGYKRLFYSGKKLEKEDKVSGTEELIITNDINTGQWVCKGIQNHLFTPLWNKIYISSIIKENKISFDNDLKLCEDCAFNLEYIKYVKSIKIIDKCVYRYCVDSGSNSVTHQFDVDNLKNQEKYVSYLKEYFSSINCDSQVYSYLCLKSVVSLFALVFNDKSYNLRKINDLSKKIVNSKIYTDLATGSNSAGIVQHLIIKLFERQDYRTFVILAWFVYMSRKYGRCLMKK